MVDSLNNQLSKNDRNVGGFARPANPELHCLVAGSVDYEFLSRVIVGRSGEDPAHIRAMSQLSQAETAYVNSIFAVPLPGVVDLCPQVNYRFVVQLQVDYKLYCYVFII